MYWRLKTYVEMWPSVFLVVLFASVWSHPTSMNENGEDVARNIREHLGERIYGTPLKSTGELLENYDPEVDMANPEELGEYAEGDILFPLNTKNGLVGQSSRWPGGVVPYQIDPSVSNSFRSNIMKAIEEYHKNTCVRFRPKQANDRDYVFIRGDLNGCYSSVGRTGGRQDLNLQPPGCTKKIGTALHELMHVLGFVHEHTRYERDDYVTINWQNIRKESQGNFQKYSSREVDGFGVEYDYGSVMHYSKYAFSKNNRPTVEAKRNFVEIGQREGFSKGDIQKINTMYKCNQNSDQNAFLSLFGWG